MKHAEPCRKRAKAAVELGSRGGDGWQASVRRRLRPGERTAAARRAATTAAGRARGDSVGDTDFLLHDFQARSDPFGPLDLQFASLEIVLGPVWMERLKFSSELS